MVQPRGCIYPTRCEETAHDVVGDLHSTTTTTQALLHVLLDFGIGGVSTKHYLPAARVCIFHPYIQKTDSTKSTLARGTHSPIRSTICQRTDHGLQHSTTVLAHDAVLKRRTREHTSSEILDYCSVNIYVVK